MEDFERTVEGFHKDANLKFAHEYEVKKKSNIDIYIYISYRDICSVTQ